MEKKPSGLSKVFLIAGIAAVAGGAYYLYSKQNKETFKRPENDPFKPNHYDKARESARSTIDRLGKLAKMPMDPNIGKEQKDGSIYAGKTQDGKALYTTPKDAPKRMTLQEAFDYAANMDAHGHKDWRVPTEDELATLLQNKDAIGNFNKSGQYPSGYYHAATPEDKTQSAKIQNFGNGKKDEGRGFIAASVRFVRTDGPKV